MRWRGVHHVEVNVLDYEESIAFYDAMFGWLGYMSFWTADIEYRSTYYMARFPAPHSYIGIQPAATGTKLHHADQSAGINHIALWARSRREIDRFYGEFLTPRGIPVVYAPQEYPEYSPGYYAVFFDDPISGIQWELARMPTIPSPAAAWRSWRVLRAATRQHPEWTGSALSEARRTLPGRDGSGPISPPARRRG
ncbi:VOC family protein [Mycolicibacterium palauense]|uniref:VOC family protein n=1 Tax=Mycolicibacterium palauense TaxID=2034511 RepID=UPI000BFED3A2|nr:VOC family protein [Mycolicibacterium palauense]